MKNTMTNSEFDELHAQQEQARAKKEQENAVAQALGNTLLSGGSTSFFGGLQPNAFPYTCGFVVGGLASELKCEADNPAKFKMCLEVQVGVKEKLYGTTRNIGVGTWIEDGDIYFDIIQVTSNRDIAVNICIERGEKAYYDIEAGKSVYIETEDALNTL